MCVPFAVSGQCMELMNYDVVKVRCEIAARPELGLAIDTLRYRKPNPDKPPALRGAMGGRFLRVPTVRYAGV